MHPKLRFRISYQKDIQAFFAFLKDSKFDKGKIFKEAVLAKYPILQKFASLQPLAADKVAVSQFVKNFYQKHSSLIKKNLKTYRINWFGMQDQFDKLTDELFPPAYWPKGKYIAYPTVWAMYPRFLRDKTFQIPYNHPKEKYVNVVIAHEMLHFIFYSYILKKIPQYEEKDDGFFLWNISEIFNTVVQNSPKWLTVFQLKSMGYPEHKKIVKTLQKKYYQQNSWKVNQLIEDIIEAVEK